ncbi:shikimate dehydrogenase family protein [Burkholderia lata]|uniref:shikimate dehydrogenase family protein n=1 Tax=Burkholderia lata (strain ATCC 17760 / DSM 23089 / LMG 22485 / NCIMB 9086 / R18194 / 383) TaxID=482957 RepID=UPI001C2F0DAF|nr:shikimate dehydrogenase [Burkholderia lata]
MSNPAARAAAKPPATPVSPVAAHGGRQHNPCNERGVSEMFELLSGETRLFPIIGDPIRFVKSPQRLTSGFEARGYNGICFPMQVAAGAFDAVMSGLSATPNVDGLLITMPHKFTAFAHCATSSPTARLLGGVSVMRRNQDGTWHGGMLDGLAFVKAQIDEGARPQGAKVLLVGAGAAGSAIAIALLEAGVRELVIHDADASRVEQLLAVIGELGRGRAHAGPADPTGCEMVCNATPMGMADGDPLPVAGHLLSASMFVGDVIAGHGVTPFLQAAQAAGCKTANGVQMVEAVQEMMLDFMMGK